MGMTTEEMDTIACVIIGFVAMGVLAILDIFGRKQKSDRDGI